MMHWLRLLARLLLALVAVFAISVGCRQLLDLEERRPHPLEVITHLGLGLACWTASCLLAPRSPHRPRDEEDGQVGDS